MAAIDRKGGQKPAEGTPNQFKKLLEGPCSNNAFLIKHLYKDCSLMKRLLSIGYNKGEHWGTPTRPQKTSRRRTAAFQHKMAAS